MEKIGKFVTWLALFVAAVFIGGIVWVYLWSWFVLPLGVKQITIAQGLGIGLLVRWATMDPNSKTDSKESPYYRLGMSLGVDLLIFLFGFLIHLFM